MSKKTRHDPAACSRRREHGTLAKTVDGKLIEREVSVFKGQLSNFWSKLMDEADQIGRGMSDIEKTQIALRDVFIQVVEEHAQNPALGRE
ncbi:hypothetical protein [Bremerella cremea]|uniref:hypothetical protein n=1 Tax=Bremerella cremea TaxID=1031537 RepID=UPI0011C0799B|nr:hypothetical protein [Bremerella cremea]